MSDVYEWRRFEIGERVRVRASAECPIRRQDADEIDGATGVVAFIVRPPLVPGHPYAVDLDNGLKGWTAAAELEPIEAES